MKAIALKPGTKNIRLSDYPDPKIQNPDEIKAKVLRVGICGTDREEASGGRANAPSGESELIIGHEMVSQVVEVGSGVKRFKPGDHLVFTVRRGCGQCEACHNDRYDMCATGNYTERGIKGRHGFQSEYVVDKECFALSVPASIADIAVLAEPMSVVEKAIDEAGIIQTARLNFIKDKPHWLQGKTVLVAGLGPIGLLAGLILSLRGAILLGLDVVDPNSARAQIFKAMGGTYINDREVNISTFQKKYPDIKMIVEAAGIAKLDFDLLEMLGINGVFVLTGVPGDQRPINVDGADIMRKLVLKNQVMLGSVNASIDHFKMGIADLEAASKKWPGLVQKMISQKIPYAQFEKAFSEHSPDEIKVVIQW